jgi:outer membrane protein insertion porin family
VHHHLAFVKSLLGCAGIGLRLDVKFFVLRFDLAMPLRKPWLPQEDRWVINQIDFGNPPGEGKI